MNAALVVTVLALGPAAEGPPDEVAPPSSPTNATEPLPDPTTAVLAQLAQASAEIETVRARFRQVRHTPVLRKPLESSGTISVAPDLIVWETAWPMRSTMSVANGEMRLYYPQDRLLEIYPLDEHFSAVVATPLLRPDHLRDHFEITLVAPESRAETEDHADEAALARARLRMTPKAEVLQHRVASILVEIELETGLVRCAEMVGAGGERTEYFFDEIETSLETPLLDPTRSVPEGTTVSHPRTRDVGNRAGDNGGGAGGVPR